MDDAKFISAIIHFTDLFGKWLFDLLNPPKSPQNNREKSETKIMKITYSGSINMYLLGSYYYLSEIFVEYKNYFLPKYRTTITTMTTTIMVGASIIEQ